MATYKNKYRVTSARAQWWDYGWDAEYFILSKNAHRLGFDFEWQGRFHDHIIRDQEEHERITRHILNNPARWEEDKFFTPITKHLKITK